MSVPHIALLAVLLLSTLTVLGVLYYRQRVIQLATQAEINDLCKRLTRGEAFMPRGKSLADKRSNTVFLIRNLADNYMAPTNSAFTWALRQLRLAESKSRVKADAMSEIIGVKTPWAESETVQRDLRPFSVRVELRCSFAEACRFAEALESINPYVAISDFTVIFDTRRKEKPRVNLVADWPRWDVHPSTRRLLTLLRTE